MGDYLWDRSGVPDADIVDLERLLAPLGQQQPPAPLPLRASARPGRRMFPSILFGLAAAAAIALAVAPAWLAPPRSAPARGWEVVRLEGQATIASRTIGERDTLKVGSWLRTDADGRAVIDVGDIGRVEIGPATRVRLLAASEGHYRLGLAAGKLSAFIWAPPGQFFVDTPSSTAIDLGCAYTLQIDESGAGVLRVTSGWVGFELGDRRALIPAGAMCATRPGVGPGTPHFEDAPPPLSTALDVIDFERAPGGQRAAALDRILSAARPRDAMTLWHLLQRSVPAERDRIYTRLAELVPPPAGVSPEGIRAGDRHMLDLWWDQLGFGSAEWWRDWSRPWTR